MKIVNVSQCTGCGACRESCSRGAIAFTEDEEGFPTPEIQADKCVDCGICKKVCPAIHMPETHNILHSYAAQLLDKDILLDSSSGGLFSAFSIEIIRRGGVVYGCVWDEKYHAVFRKAETAEELRPMHGSKYVWSYAGDTYSEVKELLDHGRTVMFTGMPCQVAGLRNYLKKDYDNLYLVAFFCGGAPSPFAFQEYLKTITKDIPLKQINFKLRDKSKDGVGVHISYESPKGRIFQSYWRNPYFFCYHTKVFHRQPCYRCQYRYTGRVEDITIGDFWGVAKFHSEFDARAGVSSLLINTEKGASLFESVKDRLQISDAKLEDIADYNNLTLDDKKVEFKAPGFRKAFFEELKSNGWNSAERKYLFNKTRLKLGVKSMIPSKVKEATKRIMRRMS